MLNFKQYHYLCEVGTTSFGTEHGAGVRGTAYPHIKNEDDLKEYGAEHVSDTSTGHKVYHYRYSGETSYHAVNPDTKKIDMSVSGKEKHNVMHKVIVQAGEGNTIKAHTFLHHVITHHKKTMTVDKMTAGGKEVFKRLHDDHKDTVGMHGWHKGKPVNVGVHDPDMYGEKDNPDDKDQDEHLLLVAHPK